MGTISYRYKRITRQLNLDFWKLGSDTSHSLYVGSYGRDTAAKGVSDIDMAFALPSSFYHKFDGYQGNGQSVLLQTVKNSIAATYPTSYLAGDGQVVTIKFTDGIKFEVLPCFTNKDGRTLTYPDSNAGGSWKVTNPRSEMEAIAERNKLRANKNLKAICRMARIWRDYHSVPIGGLLIDTLAYQWIIGWHHRDKSFLYHDFLVRDFMLYLSSRDRSQMYWQAPGSGQYVWKSGNFQTSAKAAYDLAKNAIDHEVAGRPATARNKWREIFGPLYP